MTDFNRQRFDSLMMQADGLHAVGVYSSARDMALQAAEIAPEGSSEQGRAIRNVGAREARMGNHDEARRRGLEAYGIHNDIVRSMEEPTREALRERAASAMHLAAVLLSDTITAMRAGNHWPTSPLPYARTAWQDIQSAQRLAPPETRQQTDQYQINIASRVSLAETLTGSRDEGRRIGWLALRLALKSESPSAETSNPNLSTPQRLKAKGRALFRGAGAMAVNTLMTHKPSRRQNAALEIAARIL